MNELTTKYENKELYNAIVATGKSITDIAQQSGITSSTLYNYLHFNYSTNPQLKTMIALSSVLNVSVRELLKMLNLELDM